MALWQVVNQGIQNEIERSDQRQIKRADLGG